MALAPAFENLNRQNGFARECHGQRVAKIGSVPDSDEDI
jgi:hypothetical protein